MWDPAPYLAVLYARAAAQRQAALAGMAWPDRQAYLRAPAGRCTGLLYADLPDLLGLIAPRPLLVGARGWRWCYDGAAQLW